MNKKIISILFLIIFSCIVCISENVYAADAKYIFLETMPGTGAEKGHSVADAETAFSNYVVGIYEFAVAAVVISALMMVTIGGFMYITSAGNQAQAGTAKKVITDALLGLVVVFTIYIVLKTINPDLVNVDVNFSSMVIPRAITNTTDQKQISKESGTSCGTSGGKQVCYATQSACEASGAEGCVAGNDAISNDKYYKQEDGILTEITKEEYDNCTQNCMTGTDAKKKTKYTTLTKEEIQEDLTGAGVTTKDGVDVTGMPEVTKQAVIDVGGEKCANGACEKNIIHTEGKGTNVADLADDSGTFFDSTLVNAVQDEAYKVGKTKIEKLPGGTALTYNIRKTTTYTYPEGHKLAGSTVQIIQEGQQTKGASWIPGTFAPTSSKVRVLGEKNVPPKSAAPPEDADPVMGA